MDIDSLNWKISAKAGEGVMSASKLFAKACKKQGLAAFNYYEYPSLIKGGLQSGQVYASVKGATCQKRALDMLVVFHENFITSHLEEITEKTIILLNAATFNVEKFPDLKAKVVPVNLSKIARDLGVSPLSSNIVALGFTACLFEMNLEEMGRIVIDEFAKDKESAIKTLSVLKAGFEAAEELVKVGQLSIIGKLANTGVDEQMLLTGNEAIGLGALAGGLQFYSAYPMTPATGLLHYLAAQQKNYPIVVKHAEDELGAINHALGAAYAGVRAMTGSSGGGFALMVESLSFAGVSEIPLVVSEAMRQGPATGLPTWTSQGDLNFVLTAGHGDFLRVILTPGTVQEHFELGKLAIELAEKYQLPVLILSDKYILESHQTMPKVEMSHQQKRMSMVNDGKLGETGLADGEYLRYKDSEDGISLRSIPGQSKALQLTNSYDHDEYGFATEDAVETKKAVDKRAKKLTALKNDLPKPVYFGNQKANKILISFGSTINVLKDLLLSDAAKDVGVIHLPCVYPFPTEELEQLLSGKQAEVYVLEGDATGQLAGLIRRESSIDNFHSILRYDGRPFYSEDILSFLETDKLQEQYKLI